TPIKFVMRSEDVIHSFFIPAMRVKRDVLPGQYTYLSFTPVKTGTYQSFCTEYCGKEHYNMLATLRVVPKAEFERWLVDTTREDAQALLSPTLLGAKLYAENGCNACHTLDGRAL